MKQSNMTVEELTNHFEEKIEDANIHSNYFENKYEMTKLQNVLKDSCIIIDEVAICHLKDGWFQVELECEKIPPVEDEEFYLFELEFVEFSKKQLLQNISEQEKSLKKMKKQLKLLG
jgi:hypothetical protein